MQIRRGAELQLRQRQAQWNSGWLYSLGPNHYQRVQAINAIFENRSITATAVHMSTWGGAAGAIGNISEQAYCGYMVSRNISGMDNREREYLRITELLISACDGTDQGLFAVRAHLIYGDGKGLVQHFESGPKLSMSYETRSADQMVRDISMTVDQCVNWIQQRLAALAGNPGLGPVHREIVDHAQALLSPAGNSSWLKASQIESSPFSRRSEFALHIGSFPDGTPLSYSGDGSMVTIAPPGSGKTQCNVFPNLLTWAGPAVVLDISGDIYEHTGGWRAKHVGPVYKFSPLEPEASHHYNPLDFVRDEPDYIWEDSRLLAEMMIVPSLTSDPFWENEARTVLTAAIAHAVYSNPSGRRPMHTVLDVLFGGDAWDDMISGLGLAVDVRVMRQHATSLSSMNEKTLSSVLQTARSSLGAWTGERIARATSRSDWNPRDLRDGTNPTVYIYIRPNEVEAYLSLLRVFIGQHIRILTSGAVPPVGAPPILLMLDELPRLRNMPPVDEALNIGRKYGLRLWMFAQSVGQLQNAYDNADGMLGSCAVRIYMNPSGADGLADRLSEELGYVESINDNSRRRLVEAAELSGPTYRDRQIVIASGARPAIVAKDFAYRSAELVARMSEQVVDQSQATRAFGGPAAVEPVTG